MILNINFINLLNTVITSDKHKFLKVIIAQSTSVGPKNKTKPTKKVLSALKMLKKHITKKCSSTSTSTKALVDKMLVSTSKHF